MQPRCMAVTERNINLSLLYDFQEFNAIKKIRTRSADEALIVVSVDATDLRTVQHIIGTS